MLRKRLTTIGIIAVIGLTCSSARGFDGQRKGFVLGGGLGFSPVSRWSVPVAFTDISGNFLFVQDVSENKVGLGLNVLIGYAWDERNMIVYEGNVSSYQSDIFATTISQGFNGAAWYHYFGPTGPMFFSTLGIGFFVFDGDDFEANDPGLGGMIGGGYECSNHWQAGAYLSVGKSSDFGVDFSHVQVNALVSVVAF